MPGENQNPDNPMDIAEKLKQYLETLATRGLSGALNPGATEADLKNFESEHGIRLPEALADVYRAFNGQIHDRIPPGEPRWLALDEIYGKQQEWREFCETYYGNHWPQVRLPRIDAEGKAKNTLYNPFWIPFMADNEGFYCLDYDPEPNGNSGQVLYAQINTEPENSDIIHLDDSFSQWFDNHAHALTANRRAVGLTTLLDEYLAWQKANPALPLNPPANPNDIRITEHLHGIRFPANLKKIWNIYNGYSAQTAEGERWIGHHDIATVQQEWQHKLQERLGCDPETTPRPDAGESPQTQPNYIHPLWLPIYQSGDILIALDYAPGEEGSEGQPLVIYNTADYEILAEYDTFDEWLYTYLSYQLYPEDDLPAHISAASASYRQEIIAHIEKHLGPITATFRREDSDSPVDLLWLRPSANRPYHTLVTLGLSDRPMDIPDDVANKNAAERAELMIMLPPEWNISPDNLNSEQGYWPIAWLTMLADFARTPGNWLGTGYVFPNGDPMTEIADTPFSGVLVLPPFVSHPHEYYAFHSRDGTRLNLYALIPLYPGEIDLKSEQGLDVLLEHFDKTGINSEVVDIHRKDSSR